MKRLFAILIALFLLSGSALAETPVVSFDWQYFDDRYGFSFAPSYDLFQNFKGVMPGDTLTQEIIVHNNWHMPVRIYLMADPEVAEEFQPVLRQLDLTVEAGSSRIFEASASEQDGLVPTEKSPYGVLLGTFSRRGSAKLLATLTVPVSLGNEFMNEYGEIPWVFTAEEVVLPDTPDTGDDFTLWGWVAVAGMLVISLMWLLLGRKKQKEA